MTEDILHRVRNTTGNRELDFTQEMYNEGLTMIEDLCLSMVNKGLVQLGMEAPNRDMHDLFNQELQREQQYDVNDLNAYLAANTHLLNQEQNHVFNTINQAVAEEIGGFYFLDAPGGTEKTFVISLILASIRSNGGIALALASSGIAATLLEGGCTAHSALKLTLNVNINEEPTCNISKRSAMAKVLQQCKIIIWDECTMAHKKSLEALNRTMKDLRNNQQLFGGALVLLAGDFRQTLTVISRSTPADELNACLNSSNLWRYVKNLLLPTNVRVTLQNDPDGKLFSMQLLRLGNGDFRKDNDGLIKLPVNFCHLMQSKNGLIQNVFPNIERNYLCHIWLSERIWQEQTKMLATLMQRI